MHKYQTSSLAQKIPQATETSIQQSSPAQSQTGLPFPLPGDLPDPGIKPASPVAPALAGGFFTTEPAGKSPLLLK